MLVNLDATFTLSILLIVFHKRNNIFILPVEDLEIEFLNEIEIYEDKDAVKAITHLVNKYSSIWESLGFTQISPEYWMKMYLKPGWKIKVTTINLRVYSLGIEAKPLVNKTFDKM